MSGGRGVRRASPAWWTLTITGVTVALFLGFLFGCSIVLYDRSQQSLLLDFKQHIAAQTGKTLAEGDPAALLSIPRLGSTEVVVQGTSPQDLQAGPGHYAGSPMPGEFGNVLIMGRRTTYGGPFRALDQLVRGDQIDLTTANGSFTYDVSAVERSSAGQAAVLDGTPDSRLTLITSDPVLLPTGRLAVVAVLHGSTLGVPQTIAAPTTGSTLGLAGDWGGLARGAGWAAGLAVAAWLTVRVGRRWPATVRNLLATPVLLTLFVLMCTSLATVLPGTL